MPEPTAPVHTMPPVTRRRASPLVRVGMIAFAIGVVAVGVIMVLFASGAGDLPLALNLTAMLAPVGFGVAMVGVYREARRASARVAAGSTGSTGPAVPATPAVPEESR